MGPAFAVSSIGETGPHGPYGPHQLAEVAGLVVLEVAHPPVLGPKVTDGHLGGHRGSRSRVCGAADPTGSAIPSPRSHVDGGIARRVGSGANAVGRWMPSLTDFEIRQLTDVLR